MRPFQKMRESRGGTAVEFALVLPFFALLILGTIDFGNYFFIEHTIQYATREGTRLALVGGQLSDSKGNLESRQASIIQTIQDHASIAVNPGALIISIFPVDPNQNYQNPTNWQGQQNPGNGGDYMRVVVQYTYTFWTPIIGQFFPQGQQAIMANALYHNEAF